MAPVSGTSIGANFFFKNSYGSAVSYFLSQSRSVFCSDWLLILPVPGTCTASPPSPGSSLGWTAPSRGSSSTARPWSASRGELWTRSQCVTTPGPRVTIGNDNNNNNNSNNNNNNSSPCDMTGSAACVPHFRRPVCVCQPGYRGRHCKQRDAG